MPNSKNNDAVFNNNFKTDYINRIQDKNNSLRYVIYFCYLKKVVEVFHQKRNL